MEIPLGNFARGSPGQDGQCDLQVHDRRSALEVLAVRDFGVRTRADRQILSKQKEGSGFVDTDTPLTRF